LEQLLLKLRKKSLINTKDKFGWTPIHYASRLGHLKFIRRFIREGGDPNSITAQGVSALHFLARLEPPADNLKLVVAFQQTIKVPTPRDSAFGGTYVSVGLFGSWS
jgi:hypothetical protein